MRDYKTKSNSGALPDSNAADKYGAGEVNSLRSEAKAAVSRAGLTLAPQDGSGEDTTQLAQSQFINGVGASTFQAAGTANAITLTPRTGASGLLLPPDYSTLDGAQISFFAGFDNTGAATFSIGQTGGTQFGTKKILDEAGAELIGGEILTDSWIDLIYDAAADSGSGAGILVSAPTTSSAVLLQEVHSQDGAVATGTTQVPMDDSIPTNTEGDEYMSLPITASSASNIVEVEFTAIVSFSTVNGTHIGAIFQDSGASAIAVAAISTSSATSQMNVVTVKFIGVVGTTSATTFKLRIGNSLAGTTTFNGQGGARRFGGVAASTVSIKEFTP